MAKRRLRINTQRLIELRMAMGLNQSQLARKLSECYDAQISPDDVHRFERGQRLGLRRLALLSSFFDVSMNDLVNTDVSSEKVQH